MKHMQPHIVRPLNQSLIISFNIIPYLWPFTKETAFLYRVRWRTLSMKADPISTLFCELFGALFHCFNE